MDLARATRTSVFFLLLAMPLAPRLWSAPPPPGEDHIRKKLNEVKQQITISQAELTEANQQEQELAAALGLTQGELETFSEKLRETRTQMLGAQTQLELIQQRIREIKADLLRNQFTLEQRLRDIEMQGEVSYLSVLLQSTSFSDFLNQSEYMQRVVNSDQTLIRRVRHERETLEVEKQAAIYSLATVKKLKESFEDRVNKLDDLQTKQALYLARVQSQRRKLQRYVSELEHTTAEMEERLQRIIRERQIAPGSGPVSAGKYMWPVQGPITSEFGYRVHPVTGNTKFHSGLDIAVDEGTPIRAADNGTVIYADWYGGYGNCVIIEHGGGFTTLYGHCSRLDVRQGQQVRQGQSVAAVGSTGMSTGPHLHWEVRSEGTPIDPHGRL
jgi:murein DD-endopeptidase MepM/ murein hydrolase activator NlpD